MIQKTTTWMLIHMKTQVLHMLAFIACIDDILKFLKTNLEVHKLNMSHKLDLHRPVATIILH
jgi:hypothetical protein